MNENPDFHAQMILAELQELCRDMIGSAIELTGPAKDVVNKHINILSDIIDHIRQHAAID